MQAHEAGYDGNAGDDDYEYADDDYVYCMM